MSSFETMVEDTLAEMSSYVRNQESITVLTQAASASDLTLTVDETSALSRGVVEVGDELVYVKSLNKTAGTVSVMPGGRGWRGSSAASHGVHTIIRNNPMFPRVQVKRALNDTIKAVNLVALDSYEFEFDGSRYAYVLPEDCVDITGVSWHAPDTTEVWPLIKRFRLDKNWRDEADPTVMRTAIVLTGEFPMPGRTVRVQYTKFPVALTTSDDFADTGLPASAEDVVRLGAMYRLLTTVDMGKVTANTPSGDMVDTPITPGKASDTAKYIYQLFSVRLAEEKAKQQDNYLSIIQYAR